MPPGHLHRSALTQVPSFITNPPPVEVRAGAEPELQIRFPSALGPRATTQNGINWDYGGFGSLTATQG